MPHFESGSRARRVCGCVVSDPARETHLAFLERIDPAPVEHEPTEVPLL